MSPSPLDLFPRPLQSAVHSAGYRMRRWNAARQVLGNRIAKDRIHGLLGEALKRWGIGPAEAPPAELSLTFALTADRLWLGGGLSEQPVERALLHLPALRSFWRQELRQSHFDALRAIVPHTWVKEEISVPPGAVIQGLGIPSWDHLNRLNGRTPTVVADGCFLTEPFPSESRINASYHRDDKRRVVLRSVEALP